eukprot:947482_1
MALNNKSSTMLYKHLVIVFLSVYAFLTSQTIGSTYRLSTDSAGHKCSDGPGEICNMYCDGDNGGNRDLFDCANAGECNFYCDNWRCANTATINATLSNNLNIIVGDNGETCLLKANVYAPNNGNATFDMGNSLQGFNQMKVHAGTATQNIIIDMSSTTISDVQQMEVHGYTAKNVQIAIGNNNEWSSGVLECPLLPSFAPTTTAPCIVDASNGIITNTDIYAPDGIPYNFWILPGTYSGTNTLHCANVDGYNGGTEGGSSNAPFTVDSDCWWTANPTVSPTFNPTFNPTLSPTNPTNVPTKSPTYTTSNPSLSPTNPTRIPTESPTYNPSKFPSINPSSYPSLSPTNPTSVPTQSPSDTTSNPTLSPSNPTSIPTGSPTYTPSNPPTSNPSFDPTLSPSNPTNIPTQSPTDTTSDPSFSPTKSPTRNPSITPTSYPSAYPTISPTIQTSIPTQSPIDATVDPSSNPSVSPTSNTDNPSVSPTSVPSLNPTSSSINPTATPTATPSDTTSNPSLSPSRSNTLSPTAPTSVPSQTPSNSPSQNPSSSPTSDTSIPSFSPSVSGSVAPSSSPITSSPSTSNPTLTPSRDPTIEPTIEPTTGTPTTGNPSASPSGFPSKMPTGAPTTATPTTSNPTTFPSVSPSRFPTQPPTLIPTQSPTVPTITPSASPSDAPTTSMPSVSPTTAAPSITPTVAPSSAPKYWVCDDDCYHESTEVDKLQIKVTYSFSDDITYNLDNMECFLYQIFAALFDKYQFVDTFTMCDIQIDDIEGGTEQTTDKQCEFPPCLRSTSEANQVNRRLLQSDDDDLIETTMTIIASDSNTYGLVNSLSRKGMKTQVTKAFIGAFGLSINADIRVSNGEAEAAKWDWNTINPLWYIIGGLVLILLLIVCLLCWYICRSRALKRKLSHKQGMDLDAVDEGEGLKGDTTIQRVPTNSYIHRNSPIPTNNLIPVFLVGDKPIHQATASSIDFGVYTQGSLRPPQGLPPSRGPSGEWYDLNEKTQHVEMVGHNPLFNPNAQPKADLEGSDPDENTPLNSEDRSHNSKGNRSQNTSPPVTISEIHMHSNSNRTITPVISPMTGANNPHVFHNTFHHHSMKRMTMPQGSSDRSLPQNAHFPSSGSRSGSLDRTRVAQPPSASHLMAMNGAPPAGSTPWMQYPPTMNWEQYANPHSRHSSNSNGRDLNPVTPPNNPQMSQQWNMNYNQYQHAMHMYNNQKRMAQAHAQAQAQGMQQIRRQQHVHTRSHSDVIRLPPMQQVVQQPRGNMQPQGAIIMQQQQHHHLRPVVRHQASGSDEEGSGSSDTNMLSDDEYDAKTQYAENSMVSQSQKTEQRREDRKKSHLKAAIIDTAHASSVSKGMLANMSNMLEFQEIDCDEATHQLQDSEQTNITMLINDPEVQAQLHTVQSVDYKEFLPNSGKLDVLIDEDMIVSEDENDPSVLKPRRKHSKRENTEEFHRRLTLEARGGNALMDDVLHDVVKDTASHD